MSKLRKALEAVEKRLRGAEGQHKKVGHRWEVNHKKAVREHKAQKAAERASLKAGKAGHKALAGKEAAKADRCRHRAIAAHRRAVYFVARAKELVQEINDLSESAETKRKKLQALEDRGARRSAPNKVTGGSDRANLELAMHLSEEHGGQFYSQSGPRDLEHGITGPSPGHRHDCSSWFTSMYRVCNLPDPNGGNYSSGEIVYTGTLGEHGRPISEGELDSGDAILFGEAPFHHVEMKDGPMSAGPWTVGHGSDPIDRGTVSLLPGPRAFRRYIH